MASKIFVSQIFRDTNLWLIFYGFCEMAHTVSRGLYIRGSTWRWKIKYDD